MRAGITYRLLNNCYTSQVPTAQILLEGWRAVGLNVQIEMKENWSQIFDRAAPSGVRDNSNAAPFNDPVGTMDADGPNGQQWSAGEWRSDEAARLLGMLETSTDMAARRAAFRRTLEVCEREDPAYIVLHQTASLTAKRRDPPWRAGGSFAMDFSARNWGGAT